MPRGVYVRTRPPVYRGRVCTRRPVSDRLWSHVTKGPGCWVWTGFLRNGYGRLKTGQGDETVAVHRLSYELLVGPIPAGLEIDHLCRNRACVRPDHLEPVTSRENVLRGVSPIASFARQTHCKRGHPFDDNNTYLWRGRTALSRHCRACRKERERANVPEKAAA